MSTKLLLANGSERGNALFLILIAVALFAALSYAITQSGRGSGTVDREAAIIAAGQVVQSPASIRTAVTRMIITGTAASTITFTSAATTTDVFSATGGGATNVPPPAAAGSATAWTFVPAFAAGVNGNYLFGVGSAETEALAVLPGITLTVCTQIQRGLGFASATPVVGLLGPVVWGTAGAYAAGGSPTTVKGTGVTLDGQAFACFQNTTAGLYHYYHAIIEQ